jgi:hypothetical protein
MTMPPDRREQLILDFARDPVVAHQTLFKHRHPDDTPPFHDELVELWHSSTPNVLVLAFRGGGKSTLAEEAIVLAVAAGFVRNVLIIGSSFDRAADRLRAIKHELETNELLIELYGDLRGPIWGVERLVLANGAAIQAFGRGQSLRGVKHLDTRPDLVFADDVEEEEHVRTPEARQQTWDWFMRDLMPALDRNARIRIAATPLDRDSLPMRLKRQSGWSTRTYPIEHIDPRGERRATWPARYPLDWIDAKRREFDEAGMTHAYAQEYLCEPEDPASRVFLPSMIKVEPRVRVFEPAFAFYDPARTTTRTSATTGWVVWSFVGKHLVVWDGGAEFWKPDQILDHMFKLNADYEPVVIGVETNGLEEFLLQPLRDEQLRRHAFIARRGLSCPQGQRGVHRATAAVSPGRRLDIRQEHSRGPAIPVIPDRADRLPQRACLCAVDAARGDLPRFLDGQCRRKSVGARRHAGLPLPQRHPERHDGGRRSVRRPGSACARRLGPERRARRRRGRHHRMPIG